MIDEDGNMYLAWNRLDVPEFVNYAMEHLACRHGWRPKLQGDVFRAWYRAVTK